MNETTIKAVQEPSSLPGNPSENHWDDIMIHERSLRGYLRQSFPSIRDSDDIVQETLLRVWRSSIACEIRNSKAYLFRVAKHLALDIVRRRQRSPVDRALELCDESAQTEEPSAPQRMSRDEKIRLLTEAIDSLPPKCREIVILRKLKMVAVKEIALSCGISPKGVEIQVTRGLVRCRRYLADRGVSSLFDHD